MAEPLCYGFLCHCIAIKYDCIAWKTIVLPFLLVFDTGAASSSFLLALFLCKIVVDIDWKGVANQGTAILPNMVLTGSRQAY